MIHCLLAGFRGLPRDAARASVSCRNLSTRAVLLQFPGTYPPYVLLFLPYTGERETFYLSLHCIFWTIIVYLFAFTEAFKTFSKIDQHGEQEITAQLLTKRWLQ